VVSNIIFLNKRWEFADSSTAEEDDLELLWWTDFDD
jgi:hypothetical protein